MEFVRYGKDRQRAAEEVTDKTHFDITLGDTESYCGNLHMPTSTARTMFVP